MPVLDYHHKILCQAVWQPDEIRLATYVRDLVMSQISSRFPRCIGAYLVGDLTGHYYDQDSDFDILIHSTSIDVSKYAKEAKLASGWVLDGTTHQVNFYILPASVSIGTVVSKFGAAFNVMSETWVGARPAGNSSELAEKTSFIRWINWNLYKRRTSFSVDPYGKQKLHLLTEVFSSLKPTERASVVSGLKMLTDLMDRHVRKTLLPHPSPVWKMADEFDSALSIRARDAQIAEFIQNGLPEKVATAFINRFRYKYTIEQLEQINNRISKSEQSAMMDKLPRVLIYSSVKGDGAMSSNWETHNDVGYTAVVVNGSYVDLSAAKPLFASIGIDVEDASNTSLILRDVMQDRFGELQQIVDDNHLAIVGTYGEKQYLRRTQKQVRRALKLSVQPGKWYFAENLTDFPLVVIRNSTIEKVADTEDEIQLLELDMYEANTLAPNRQFVAAPDVSAFGLRPATIDDFNALGVVPPSADQLIEASVIKTAGPNYDNLKNFGVGVD